MTHDELLAKLTDTHLVYARATLEGFKINGLPVAVVDDDFFEYLEEEGVEGSLELVELMEYWAQWEKENLL